MSGTDLDRPPYTPFFGAMGATAAMAFSGKLRKCLVTTGNRIFSMHNHYHTDWFLLKLTDDASFIVLKELVHFSMSDLKDFLWKEKPKLDHMTCWTRVRKTKVLRPLRNKVRQKDYLNMCFRWISDLCHKNPLKQTNQNLIYHMIQLLKAAALVKISRVIPKVKILYGYEFGT